MKLFNWTTVGFYLVLLVFVVLANIAIISGVVWVVVKVLRGMGVIS